MHRSGVSLQSLLLILGAGVLWPAAASASDMTILMFFASFPACIVLVAVAFLMARLLPPRASVLLLVPIGILVAIHIYLLPHMYHGAEITAFAIQAAVSATSLFSFRMISRRRSDSGSPNEPAGPESSD